MTMAGTLTEPVAAAGETTQAGQAAAKQDEKKIQRQMVAFTFYKVMPEWRRLPAAERAEHKRQFAEVIKRWNKPGEMLNLSYSTVGLRGDVDMVLWRICYSVDDLNQMMSELMATPLGSYLTTPHSLLSMTKRSQYLIGHEHDGQADSRGF